MEPTARKKKILLYVMIGLIVGFLLITAFVVLLPTTFIDIKFSEEIQEHRNPLLDTIMKAISWPGTVPASPIIVFVTALLFYLFRYKKEALFVLLTLLSGLLSTIIKWLVNRPRPSDTLVIIMGKSSQQSFPSGHVLFYVIFFGFITVLMFELKSIAKPLRLSIAAVCIFLIFSIPASRIYLGAHWFTDVLGGFILGIPCLYLLGYQYIKRTRV
ncbi:phosphatase PAP2 family protein [Mucilaginibacter gynuensis]|uniref:Phosphatase PAP2 family protein n=1 Tax=Mucilaginibacter gynuensis TaxID=1302236 RepID=A0ABP8FSY5_9SPHI